MRKELEKQGQNFLILIIVSIIVQNAIIEQKNTRKLKLAPNTHIFNIKEKEKCYKISSINTYCCIFAHYFVKIAAYTITIQTETAKQSFETSNLNQTFFIN